MSVKSSSTLGGEGVVITVVVADFVVDVDPVVLDFVVVETTVGSTVVVSGELVVFVDSVAAVVVDVVVVLSVVVLLSVVVGMSTSIGHLTSSYQLALRSWNCVLLAHVPDTNERRSGKSRTSHASPQSSQLIGSVGTHYQMV